VPALRRNRDFVLLQAGELLSSAGTAVTALAYPLVVLAASGSPARAGLVTFARLAPFGVLGLFAGVAADRWDRRALMVGADAVRALALTTLATALAAGGARFGHILAVAVVEGSGATVFRAARAGALRAVVPRSQLPAAVGVEEARESAVRIGGPPLGGALFGLGAAVPFAADAVSYLASGAAVLTMRARFQEPRAAERTPLRTRIAEGIRFLWGHPFLRACALIYGGGNVLIPGILLALVVVARGAGLSGAQTGVLLALFGTGTLVGSLVSPLFRRHLSVRAIMLLELWTWLAPWVFVAWPDVHVLAASLVPLAVAAPVTDSVVVGYRVAMTPDRLLGRVESVRSAIALSLAPLGPLAAGLMLEALSARATVAVFATLGVALAVAATSSRSLREAPSLDELAAV